MMSILELCTWLQNTQFGTAVRESTLAFPVLEGTHLLGLTFMLGPTFAFDLRLSGLAWRDQPVSKIYKSFLPLTNAGAALMVITGIILFWSEPVKCYNSTYFRLKVIALIVASLNAGIFHFGYFKTVATWDVIGSPPTRARMAGYASIVLWLFVVLAGRYTAYNL